MIRYDMIRYEYHTTTTRAHPTSSTPPDTLVKTGCKGIGGDGSTQTDGA